ncbi:hypothetical protein [Aequorivita marisscotiae]|uniref:Uncharacterized protein n=1 Tax=Aequorivita marisscotiae TaxID=3040348 RepID=A0ABY8KRV2_9FLAO|nr:hypothetical protein [Aequorivita sp. Ant34-E75]WGF92178.1 hypothetical protein QCQ61_13315 [Aequorivita sp. Ant34-E75]
MGTKVWKYLILEHLPVLIDVYSNGLNEISRNQVDSTIKTTWISEIDIESTNLQELIEKYRYDFICVNFNFPFSNQKKHQLAIDFLAFVTNHYPAIRIMVSVQNTTVYKMKMLYQKINPTCIIDVRDCTQKTVNSAFNDLSRGEIFYSKTVLQLFHKYLEANGVMDSLDYEILYELSIGTPINVLPKKVLLSASVIYRKKIRIKEFFGVAELTDSELVQEARRRGFV